MSTSVPRRRPNGSLRRPSRRSGDLVKDASASVSTIVRGEIELAKLELRSSIRTAGVGVGFFVAAAAIAVFSLFFLFIGVAELITCLGVVRYGAYLIVFGADAGRSPPSPG